MTRTIIFTGKGGVGKTSVAAAHAVRSAREGCRTLLVSADMAHNLGDLFGTEVGSAAKRAADHLYLQELDPGQLMRQEFPNARQALIDLMAGAGLAAGGLTETFPLPGFDILFSLLKIGRLCRNGGYDRLLVDCPPTGETLALLKFPELLSWYMEKFYPVGKAVTRAMAPVAGAKYRVKLPSRKAMNEIGRLHESLVELQELLRDGSACTVRLVCIPEKMAVEETKRSLMQLNLYGYCVDGAYINRVLPEEAGGGFLLRWRESQQRYLDELERVFAGYPMTRLPWYPQEVRGMEAAGQLADALPETPGLFEIRAHAENETYEATGSGWLLRLRLPGAEGGVSVCRRGNDLEIHLPGAARCLPLPDTLRTAVMTGYALREGTLRVSFQNADGSEGGQG